MPGEEAASTIFKVFGMTWPGSELMLSHTQADTLATPLGHGRLGIFTLLRYQLLVLLFYYPPPPRQQSWKGDIEIALSVRPSFRPSDIAELTCFSSIKFCMHTHIRGVYIYMGMLHAQFYENSTLHS